MPRSTPDERPTRWNRDAVLRSAVALADRDGIEAVSMRNLADHLGVVPMALYKHVADKEALLDGMVDVVVGEIGPVELEEPWKDAVRARVLTARETLRVHPWARVVFESRTSRSPVVLGYLDSIAALFLRGGLSADLTHHVMHALGSRVWGFTQDLFDDPTGDAPPPDPERMAELVARMPALAAVAGAVRHEDSAIGYGCDDQFEFEFALDLLLDGIERRHAAGWSSRPAARQAPRARRRT